MSSVAPLRIMVNGVESTQHSVMDRAFHYGDGVFRSLRVERGRACLLSRQLARLCDDARRIGLTPPGIDALADEVNWICRGHEQAVLKIILTRGVSGRGYAIDPLMPVNCLQLLFPVPTYPADWWRAGIAVRLCQTRLGLNPRLAGIKHLNRLEQVLARAEWGDPGIAEGLLLDIEGRLVEGVSSNLFMLRDGELMTADLSRCGVAGVMREMILEAAPAYTRAVSIRDLTFEDLTTADECFVCNSVWGVWPIARLDERCWPVGPVTRQLQTHPAFACPSAE